MALLKTGSNQIVSITENTVEAKLCNILYDNAVDFVISEGEWSRSIFRAVLAQTTTTPAFEYTYAYQLPTDPLCLNVLSIDEYVSGDVAYAIEDDKLLSDQSTMSIRYQGRITDPQKYGVFLTRAIVSKLAMEIAYAQTANASLVGNLEQQYEKAVMDGLARDGQQGIGEQTVNPTLTEIR